MSLDTPEPVFARKSDYAYLKLRELIRSGEISEGAEVNQEALSAQLGVSTTPIREALRRLEAEGFVVLGAHKNARVTPLTVEEAQELLEMRVTLHALAAGLAATRATEADVEGMRSALRSLAEEPTNAAYRELHRRVYSAAHNTLLDETLDRLWARAERYRDVIEAPRDQVRQQGELKALVDAIAAHDVDAARELMAKQIEQGSVALAIEILDRRSQ